MDPVLVAVHDALADVDRQLRVQFPQLFRKVDRIKSKPREPQQMQPFDYTGATAICPGCGHVFPKFCSTARYCQPGCGRSSCP